MSTPLVYGFETVSQHSGWFYLSFVARARFLGGCVVRGETMRDAVATATRLGIHPGGEEVLALALPHALLVPEGYRNRLLTLHDVRRVWPDAGRVGDDAFSTIVVAAAADRARRSS